MARVKPAGISLREWKKLTHTQKQPFAPRAASTAGGKANSVSVVLTGALAGFRKETRWCNGDTRKYALYISPGGTTFRSMAAALRAVSHN